MHRPARTAHARRVRLGASARSASLAVLCLATASCTLPYYWQAARGQLDLVRRRVPIDAVLEDPRQPDAIKETLRRVLEMRRFAVEELGLPDNDSYRSYADLKRPYVVWNVVAAEEFSVEARQWCFAFVGCVSYRGYFAREAAEKFASSLREQGLDTYVAGASAYSTLGYFSDPVLNTMLVGGEAYVAGVLFHELAHQKFYLRGESELNEAFATAVQQYGTLQWLMRYATADELRAHRRRLGRQADFTRLVTAQRARLGELYTSGAPNAEMRSAKRAAFAHMREEYEHYKAAWGGITDYDAWFAQPLNNAQLASVTTYRRWLPGRVWYLDRYGLDSLYAEMAELENLDRAGRERRLQTLLSEATVVAH